MGLRFALVVGAASAFAAAAPATALPAAPAASVHRVVRGPLRSASVHVVKGRHAGDVARAPAVIGGANAGDRYPSVAVIEGEDSGGGFSCSGSKISSRWILTAAHCVSDEATDAVLAPDKLAVAIGNLPVSTRSDWLAVAHVMRYPGWSRSALSGDVALLELAAPVDEWSLEMASLSREPARPTAGAVVGFGLVGENPDVDPNDMQAGATTIWPAATCAQAWQNVYAFDAASQLCAGTLSASTPPATTCSGDSGGPLLFTDALGDWIVGTTSFGASVSCLAAPSVFSRVAAFRSWILKTTGFAAERIASAKQVRHSETSGVVAVTVTGTGVDALIALGPDAHGNAYDGVWVRGEGAQTATLIATKLWPGTAYDLDVTADSFYGATARTRVTLVTDDTHRPALRLARLRGHRGKRLAIHVHVSDNSPWLGYRLTIQRRSHVVARFSLRVSDTPHAKRTLDRTLRWLVPAHAKAGLKVCGHAVDGVGNASRTTCTAIRLLS
jgi:secreted trypsin-like serine protease